MDLIELKHREDTATDIKLNRIYSQLGELLNELSKKELTQNIIESINQDVELLNSSSLIGSDFRKLLKQKQTKILKQVEKDFKIVPQNYYRNLWLALGMSSFGIPIGVAFGISMGNLGLLGLGLPIGLVIGIAVGSRMDKKALLEGRQLNLAIKY